MIFDASTGGNLLAAMKPTEVNIVPEVVNGNVVRLWNSNVFNIDTGGNCTGTEYCSLWKPGSVVNGTVMGGYMMALIADWFFRGFDSMNQLFPVSSFPNIYANFWDVNAGTVITKIPRLTIARSTGSWSAPVNQNAGVNLERKIANTNALTFAAATSGATYNAGSILLEFRMSNTPQSFNDILFRTTIGAVTWVTGDVLQFTANNCEIVLN